MALKLSNFMHMSAILAVSAIVLVSINAAQSPRARASQGKTMHFNAYGNKTTVNLYFDLNQRDFAYKITSHKKGESPKICQEGTYRYPRKGPSLVTNEPCNVVEMTSNQITMEQVQSELTTLRAKRDQYGKVKENAKSNPGMKS